MKKILIVINNLETGGVQTSLLNLLKEIGELYDVSLVIFHYKDEYRQLVPKNVKVIRLNSPFKHFGMSAKDAEGHPFVYTARAFWVLMTRIFGRSFVIRLMALRQKKLCEYDVAISYLHEAPQTNFYGGCNEFVLKKVEAEKKITWLHCDFSLCGANTARSKAIYGRFDKIIACSIGCKNAFVKCLPELEGKCGVVRNCNDYSNIQLLAGEGIKFDESVFNMVTAARLSEEKGIERALESIKICKEKGYKIKYHLIGSGQEEEYLKTLASQLGLDNDVIFYGNKQNPYVYMKNADLFLLTSYHEAAPMVFDEAACLEIPVLATKTTSTKEMIEDTGYGFVCENSQEGITQKLLELLNDTEKIRTAKKTLADADFNNKKALACFRNLLQ